MSSTKKTCNQCFISKSIEHGFGRMGKDEICRECKYGTKSAKNMRASYNPSETKDVRERAMRWKQSGREGTLGKGWDE